jgi:nitroimidazol reductase NimA-like FMN-containing flavoprotein (pyridoxamine 5'-phosphate oxidase superfamily)
MKIGQGVFMEQVFQVLPESVGGAFLNRTGGFSMIRRLSEAQALALLSEGSVGHLGCVTERGPYVVPVNYIFHEGNIYIHSLMGIKIQTLRQNPKTCFQVDQSEDEYSWRSAIAFGRYEEITDAEERCAFMRRYLTRFPHLTPVESADFDAPPDNGIIFRIRVEQVSAVAEE